MRGKLGLLVGAADRARLAAIVADRNRPQKHVWRARVVLLSADRLGTTEIMRRTGLSKPSVWRWQERYIAAGVDGLLRDKTRPSRVPPLDPSKVAEVIRRTLEAPPGEATHWTVRAMARASGVSPAWLARHPRWVFHFTPTSCSWLNAVEGFFARLTRRRLKRGTFPSLVSLQQAINRFIEHHNRQPTPFIWSADPKNIIAAAKRGHQTLETIH
jgi:hypothetical protein